MRNISAFIIAVIVYALFLWLYVTQFSQINLPSTDSNEHIVKIDIRNMPSSKKVLSKKAPSEIVKMDAVAEALKSIVTRKSIKNPTTKTEWVKDKVVPKKIKKKPLVKKRVVKKKVTKKKSQKKPPKKHLKKKKLKKKKIVKKKPILKKKIVKKKKKIKKKKPKIVKSKIPKKRIIEEPLTEERVVEYVESTPPVVKEMVYMPDVLFLGTEDMLPPSSPSKKATKSEKESEENSLASFLGKPSKSSGHVVRNYPSEKVKKLYGSSFHNFTDKQKKFIKNNLDDIQQITQRILTRRGYPEGAGETRQEGTNVVEFYLHPNGDISNLRLKRQIGYRALDENTITLIRVAYKDYPYPETKTKIIFYVKYSVYGY